MFRSALYTSHISSAWDRISGGMVSLTDEALCHCRSLSTSLGCCLRRRGHQTRISSRRKISVASVLRMSAYGFVWKSQEGSVRTCAHHSSNGIIDQPYRQALAMRFIGWRTTPMRTLKSLVFHLDVAWRCGRVRRIDVLPHLGTRRNAMFVVLGRAKSKSRSSAHIGVRSLRTFLFE